MPESEKRASAAPDWLHDWFAGDGPKPAAAAMQAVLSVVLPVDKDPAAIRRFVEWSEHSVWAWELLQATHRFFREREDLPMPKVLGNWAADIVEGRRTRPRGGPGRPVDEAGDRELLLAMALLKLEGFTREKAVAALAEVTDDPPETVMSRFRRARLRERDGTIWGLAAARGEGGHK